MSVAQMERMKNENSVPWTPAAPNEGKGQRMSWIEQMLVNFVETVEPVLCCLKKLVKQPEKLWSVANCLMI